MQLYVFKCCAVGLVVTFRVWPDVLSLGRSGQFWVSPVLPLPSRNLFPFQKYHCRPRISQSKLESGTVGCKDPGGQLILPLHLKREKRKKKHHSEWLSNLLTAMRKFHRRTRPENGSVDSYLMQHVAIYPRSPFSILADRKQKLVEPASMSCPSHRPLISSILPEGTFYLQHGDHILPF